MSKRTVDLEMSDAFWLSLLLGSSVCVCVCLLACDPKLWKVGSLKSTSDPTAIVVV